MKGKKTIRGLRAAMAMAAVVAVGLVWPGACLAAGENDPILCIDSGGHKAMIRDVVFTRDGQSLVSASDDKTVRVWDIRTGAVRRTIRGRIGDGDEGKIYAMALSPDNEWLAAGGLFTGDREGKCSIRLYHFPTGRLTGLLKGHGNVVFSLAFSPDGKYLASGSFDHDVRVWDIRRMAGVATLTGHKNYVYALAWLPDGRRLVSGADDHDLILWDALAGKRLKVLSGHENVVRAVAVSPDGRHIASGSWDKTVRLWDGRTGEFAKVLARLSTRPSSLAFSPTGDTLLTGAGWPPYECHILSVPGGQTRLTFSRHDNLVIATAFSPDGRLAATGGGANNVIHVWDAETGRVERTLEGAGRSVWAAGFSPDGGRIAWGNSYSKKHDNDYGPLEYAMRISGGRVSLAGAVENPSSFLRGEAEWRDMRLETAEGGPYGYDDAVLKIVKDGRETARIERDATSGLGHYCYTFTPDGETVASGDGFGNITLYRASDGAKVRDLTGHTGVVWAVAASPDGKLLVSGSSDQTVRLWNIATGENLLTVFRGDDGEWVAWTRSGYYASSPGGDRYIGWQINKGADENPEYYQAAQFAEILRRPRVVAATVEYGGEKTALARLGETGAPDAGSIASLAPPSVRISRPEDGYMASADAIDLEVNIGGRVQDVRDIAVYVNGAQVLSSKQKRIDDLRGDTRKTFPAVPLKEEVNLIKVVATNIHDASAEDVIRVLRAPSAVKGKAMGDLYFLAAGVNRLENIPGNDLDFPAKDARDIAELMKKTEGKLFETVRVRLLSDLSDTKPSSDAIEDALYEARKAGPGDTILMFFSGHGVSTENDDFIFVTRDAKRYENGEYQPSSVLKWDTVREVVRKTNARVVVLLDTCYSGGVDVNDLFYKASTTNQMVVLTSSKGTEPSQEMKRLGNGVFTHAILKGLGDGLPADNNKDGEVSILELSMFVNDEVKNLTSKRQTPDLFSPNGIPDMPFFTR